jgi:hypothetical protein
MKKLKITLAVIVVAVIIVAAVTGYISRIIVPHIVDPKNQFKIKIDEKIDLLKKMPESSFCQESYKEIKYYIEDDYTNNRLGKTQSENDECNHNLSSNLYVAYSLKFIDQAFYIFNDSQWDSKKLNFIRDECKALQKNGLHEKNTKTEKDLNEIKNILAKYNEIKDFINSCKAFKFSNYELNSDFGTYVEKYISRSKEYLENNLENNYVKNCARLKTDLSEVPMILFKAHVNYLDNKINNCIGKYNNYSSLAEYNNNLYTIIDNEIRKLKNESYYTGISIQYTEYEKLNNKLKLESNAAYKHFQ